MCALMGARRTQRTVSPVTRMGPAYATSSSPDIALVEYSTEGLLPIVRRSRNRTKRLNPTCHQK